jgi:hypothetical protein
LSVALGVLSNDPLYLKLVFKSKSDFHGTNTAEYLIATVSSPDPVPDQVVPLPAGVVLMGSVLFGACGITSWRRRRRAAA